MIHSGRCREADELLQKEGFLARYSDAVFNYIDVPRTGKPVPCPVASCFDGVLPSALVDRLASFLRDDGPFFGEHNYFSGSVGYFSYAHDLAHPEGTLLEQTALLLRETLADSGFPELRAARKIEWWAHNRSHEAGHQLHWDTDAEGESGVRHPLCTAVVFLSAGTGGPTVVTEQGVGDPMARRGWLIVPPERDVGRVAVLRGRYLHGVVGGHPRAPVPAAGRRKTLMLAFWEDVKIRPSLFQTPGACRPLPLGTKWVPEIERGVAELRRDPAAPRLVPLDCVEPFFQSVVASGQDASAQAVPYEQVFQG